jgi:peptide subunit release factor 1 (eRF1)
MISRDEIRDLASFSTDDNPEACALSFYFQPDTPQDRSHRREAILAKDLVRQAMKEAEGKGKNGWLHADLDRVLELVAQLPGQARGRAVFACSAKKVWKEFELPPRLGTTGVFIQRRFQLKPLARLLGAQPLLCVAVVDRQRARFFDLRLDELKERDALVHMLSRNSASYGFHGYEGGHAERRVAEEALQHFKAVSERLLSSLERRIWDRLVVGCQDANWSELESNLHPYVKQRVVGRFSADVASVSNEEIREHANRILEKWIEERGQSKAAEAIAFAKANGRGATGLRRVLQALETGEVQALFLSDRYSAHAVECTNCGHLDAHNVAECRACGHKTRELVDVTNALIPMAIQKDIELFYLKDHSELDRAGNIAALLRFRSDQNKSGSLAAAS